jgi:hypothetical protein
LASGTNLIPAIFVGVRKSNNSAMYAVAPVLSRARRYFFFVLRKKKRGPFALKRCWCEGFVGAAADKLHSVLRADKSR